MCHRHASPHAAGGRRVRRHHDDEHTNRVERQRAHDVCGHEHGRDAPRRQAELTPGAYARRSTKRMPAIGIRNAHEPIMIGNAALAFMPSKLTRIMQGRIEADADGHHGAEDEVSDHAEARAVPPSRATASAPRGDPRLSWRTRRSAAARSASPCRAAPGAATIPPRRSHRSTPPRSPRRPSPRASWARPRRWR